MTISLSISSQFFSQTQPKDATLCVLSLLQEQEQHLQMHVCVHEPLSRIAERHCFVLSLEVKIQSRAEPSVPPLILLAVLQCPFHWPPSIKTSLTTRTYHSQHHHRFMTLTLHPSFQNDHLSRFFRHNFSVLAIGLLPLKPA